MIRVRFCEYACITFMLTREYYIMHITYKPSREISSNIYADMRSWIMRVSTISMPVAFFFLFLPPVFAQAFSSSGYTAERKLPPGMIVSQVTGDDQLVELANRDNAENLLGVVVESDQSLFQVSSQENNVQVVTNDITEVLVTDSNGTVQTGDYITASNIDGIGIKADEDHDTVVGVARGDFSDPDVRSVETGEGGTEEIALAPVSIMVQVGDNPVAGSQSSFLPEFIQGSANALAGEPVAPARIILSLLVITSGFIGSLILLYGAVSSTIISIGRNPLSDKSIYSGLLRMISVTFGIILITSGLGYVIITVG